ncbi:hypothetical protein QTH97_28455 [Variovorax sp. J22R24]|uniref:hypothetical protein n=1 Tax=Variovorax gracilis TaxID=3053502 RepID=UPI002577A198|nr:hypothetical protein [Variovorax sp. J22R24]MDM0108905.1 hypothetical protein [Variovorax sp. J22R24]
MSIFQSVREMPPYRLLLLGTLVAIALVQVVAMVVVTRSQVQKAEAHYALERAAFAAAAAEKSAEGSAEKTAAMARPSARDGVMNVGYVVSR